MWACILAQGHQQYISVILGDGQQQYDHDKDGGDVKLAGCEYDFRGDVMDARIVYDGSLLRMYLARVGEWRSILALGLCSVFYAVVILLHPQLNPS